MARQNEQFRKPTTLTAGQLEEFSHQGLLHLPGAIAKSDAGTMCERVWDALARQHHIRRDAPETWTIPRPAQFQALQLSGAFASMASRAVCDALDDLFGPDAWQRPPRWGSLLVTFPGANPRWDVPQKSWHLDFPAGGINGAFLGVIVFAFLDTVLPAGGGTVVVTGSHRLVQDLATGAGAMRSADVRKSLARSESWFRDLLSRDETIDRVRRFMSGGELVRDVPVRVVELIGEPGDVIVMHPWMLHAPAHNCRSAPRLMLKQGILRRSGGPGSRQDETVELQQSEDS